MLKKEIDAVLYANRIRVRAGIQDVCFRTFVVAVSVIIRVHIAIAITHGRWCHSNWPACNLN